MALGNVACDHLFIDVGANSGDSLVKWFSQFNCYENCYDRDSPMQKHCLPSNETCGKTGDCANANATCFCHRQAKASRQRRLKEKAGARSWAA